MKNQQTRTLTQSILLILAITSGVLLVPFVASFVIEGFDWGIEDYLFAGLILFSEGLIYERGVRGMNDPTHKVIAIGFMLLFAALIWVEVAVGIFNSPIGGS